MSDAYDNPKHKSLWKNIKVIRPNDEPLIYELNSLGKLKKKISRQEPRDLSNEIIKMQMRIDSINSQQISNNVTTDINQNLSIEIDYNQKTSNNQSFTTEFDYNQNTLNNQSFTTEFEQFFSNDQYEDYDFYNDFFNMKI